LEGKAIHGGNILKLLRPFLSGCLSSFIIMGKDPDLLASELAGRLSPRYKITFRYSQYGYCEFPAELLIHRWNRSYADNPMIRPTRILLTAALGLIMSATAQAANVQITSLPFNITAPGTYVLVSDLFYTPQSGAAITISPNLSAPVVLNLKGHTLTGGVTIPVTNNSSDGVFVNGNGPSLSTVTIENGTIKNFDVGVFIDCNNASGVVGNALSGIDINNVAFAYAVSIGGGRDIVLANDVVSSTIRNCSFTNSDIGIQAQSAGGNRFTNNTFSNVGQLMILYGGQNISTSVQLDVCHFDAPTSD
jgi:parallel beta-helix repeat protein